MKVKDQNLLKNLDLINFWEPFDREIPTMRVGAREILVDLKKKQGEVKINSDIVKGVAPKEFTKPFVFSFNTTNQREALLPLFEAMRDMAELISENSDFTDELLPDAYLKSEYLKYSSKMMGWLYSFKGRDREVFRSRYYNFYRRLGQYNYYHNAFQRSMRTVKAYIASNDHSGLSQVGFVAARRAGIPTIYIQHASVSENFPPLSADIAFLDGEDAKEKYLAAGATKTKIHLVGSLKYDPYLKRREIDETKELVGVCIGMVYHEVDENFKLCEALEKAGTPFCLRFHPLMDEAVQKSFTDRGWEISDKEEKAPDFILRCGSIVSGDSNILLEAIILKRQPIYFASTGVSIDYYGFVEQEICKRACLTFGEVISQLSEEFDLTYHRQKAKRYNDTLGTENEGKSTELVLGILRTAIPQI
ncbi:hypothetical protein O3Q51_00600 [Cryomorphaceae bacterium 1068]|nr:hypothetical protein [Cryomorphaceae bacterium 1068]